MSNIGNPRVGSGEIFRVPIMSALNLCCAERSSENQFQQPAKNLDALEGSTDDASMS
jgi:hypothetical protein